MIHAMRDNTLRSDTQLLIAQSSWWDYGLVCTQVTYTQHDFLSKGDVDRSLQQPLGRHGFQTNVEDASKCMTHIHCGTVCISTVILTVDVYVLLPQGAEAAQQSGWDGPPRIEIGNDANGTNPLWDYYQRHTHGPLLDKWDQSFDIYHRYASCCECSTNSLTIQDFSV